MPELYICTSIETDGPVPGPHSMRSLASAAFDDRHQLISSFSVNLEPLRKAKPYPETLAYWKSMPSAWNVITHNPESPGTAIPEYLDWLTNLPGQKVFVGYPAARAFSFVEWYLFKFAGRSPFNKSALDLKTMAMTLIQRPFHQTNKRHMPPAWLTNAPPHTYVALDDAITVGRMLKHMLDARASRPKLEGLPEEELPGLVDP